MAVREWPSGARLIDEYREACGGKTVLAFSRGKDAIATALAIRDKIEIIPVHYELVPDLDFIDQGLAYYEKHLFGRRIIRLPHPNMRKHLAMSFLHQSLANAEVITSARLEVFDHAYLHDKVIEQESLPENIWTAIGVRAADSPMRRTAMNKYGPMRHKTKNWYPIWDWNKERLMDEIKRSGISLPVDYWLWGRSFDGLDVRFILPMKQHLPKDFERLKLWYPMIEADIMRYYLHNPELRDGTKEDGQKAGAKRTRVKAD